MAKWWNVYHYNAIAKEIREVFPIDDVGEGTETRASLHHERKALTTLALSLAARFYQDYLDSEEGLAFDPIKWLDQCSPDPDLFPLSELWEGSIKADYREDHSG